MPTVKPPTAAPHGLSMPPSSALANAYSNTPDIMFGSRNTIGAIIMPATAPIDAARPQPNASIQETGIPTHRAEAGFSAAARMARPTEVFRKKRNNAATTTAVRAIDPILCAGNILEEYQLFSGKGDGKTFISCPKNQPLS